MLLSFLYVIFKSTWRRKSIYIAFALSISALVFSKHFYVAQSYYAFLPFIAFENIEEIFAILELITLSTMEEALSILGGRDFWLNNYSDIRS